MMRWIVGSSLRFGRLVVAVAAGVMVLGILQVGKTSVDALPEFSPPTVEVQTEALGLSAAEVEQLITVPLEQDLLVGVAFLDEIESVSLPGLSSVVMTFEPGTDLLDARQVVQERLTQAVGVAGLPAVAKPPQMIQPLSSKSRVSMIRLSSENLTPIEMSVLSRWVIGPRLMGVPGVANVALWGNRERQLQVLVDPERLQEHDVTLSQIVSTAGNALEVSPLSFLEASKPGTGGFIDTANQRLNIFHEQAINSAQELAQVPLDGLGDGGAGNGATPPLTLGDVTEVVEDHQPLIGDAICAGGEQCLLLVVERFPGANTVEVTEGVEKALDALRPGLAGMEIDSSVYRPASYVESSFEKLGLATLVGGLLALLVIGVLLWSWRRSLIAVAAVGVSLAAALTVLYLRGTTVNLLFAAGLAVGLTAVIHDAVADVDNLGRRMRQRREQGSAASAWQTIVEATAEMRSAILYAVLIVAAATLPLFFLLGEGGAFLPPMVLSYLLAVSASMLVALVLTPVLGLALLSKAPMAHSESPVLRWTHRRYDRFAPGLVTRRGTALSLCAGVAVIGLVTIPFLDLSLAPSLKERDVVVHVEAAPGTSLPRMTDLTTQAIRDLESLPGVAGVSGLIGRAVMSDRAVDVNSGEIWVRIDPEADYDATLASVETTVGSSPDLSTDVVTYSQERVTDVLGRADGDVVVRIYGENAEVLSAKADEVRALVADVDGVTSASVERAPEESTMEVEVDLAQAQAFGIKPGDVRRAAAMLLGGITVGNLFDEQKVFDVVVWGAPSIRQSEADIEQLLIDTPDGGHVTLAEVADVRRVPNPTVIRHESVASYLDVTAGVAGRDVHAVAADVEDVVEGVTFPLEHHAEVVGGFEEARATDARLAAAALAALVAVFLLLQAAFRSWRLAAFGLPALLLALAGGLAATLMTGGTLGLGSIGGLVAVLGIAARGVVLLVRRYQHLEQVAGVPFGPELVLRGTRDTLAPTLMSFLAIVVALAPFVVVGGSGFEIVHPAAIAVLGGLVTTTLIILFVVPVLYLRFGFEPERDIWDDEVLAAVPRPRQAPAPADTGILRRVRRALVAAPIIPAVMLSACAGTVADAYVVEEQPAHVEQIAGTDQVGVVLTARAAERLGIRTVPVRQDGSGLVVPSSAVFVDIDGGWWVYTSTDPQVFVKHEIAIEREDGGQAFLSSGPPVGTEVVTVGVAELSGVEAEIGH